MEEQKLAELLKNYLSKHFFLKDEFDIEIDIKNKEEWADVSVYRKKDNKLVMQVETKADNSAVTLIGEALWNNWGASKELNEKIPMFIAVDGDHFKGKYDEEHWDSETVKTIFEYYGLKIGILEKRGEDFKIISDPLKFLKSKSAYTL